MQGSWPSLVPALVCDSSAAASHCPASAVHGSLFVPSAPLSPDLALELLQECRSEDTVPITQRSIKHGEFLQLQNEVIEGMLDPRDAVVLDAEVSEGAQLTQ